jgi:sulfide:quinone oxidoreductase
MDDPGRQGPGILREDPVRKAQSVLILGGGVGGVVAATRLRRLLRDQDRVVLVDRERNHVFQPSLLWLAVGKRDATRIQRELRRLERKRIDVVMGEATEFDAERKRVRVDGEELHADAIIVAVGADLAPELIPGLSEAGHNLFTVDGASGIRDALESFRGGRVVVLTASPAYKCPAAPYEAAMLVNDYLRRHAATALVEMFTAEPGPMGTAGPEVSAAVRGMVEAQGIAYHPEHQVERVEGSTRTLYFTNGATTPYDLLLYVPPHRAPAVAARSGLVGQSGWIPVDARTLRTSVPGVFAIGDVTGIPLPSGKALPKAGVFAHAEAEVVADNLAAEWSGRTPDREFDGVGACFIETGSGKAGYGSGNFYAVPSPDIRLRAPSVWWHMSKVLFEKRWLAQWF